MRVLQYNVLAFLWSNFFWLFGKQWSTIDRRKVPVKYQEANAFPVLSFKEQKESYGY